MVAQRKPKPRRWKMPRTAPVPVFNPNRKADRERARRYTASYRAYRVGEDYVSSGQWVYRDGVLAGHVKRVRPELFAAEKARARRKGVKRA